MMTEIFPACGKKKTGTRIIGGSNATVNEYPWMVSLRGTEEGGGHFCGGSVINSRSEVDKTRVTTNKFW